MNQQLIIYSLVIFLFVALAAFIGLNPLLAIIRKRERYYDRVLRHQLLLDVSPRMVTLATALCMLFLGLCGVMITGGSLLGFLLAAVGGMFIPGLVIKNMQRRRLESLERQIVGGIQTLASGVRAGLNLVQAMELIARDGVEPIKQEFSQLLSEYEYGRPLDEAMLGTAKRIGSADYRLLFTALHTHRQQGGDLGDTLDRIAASIREIQRLNARVNALTAEGRATARWLGAMPLVVMMIMYLIPGSEVKNLFMDDIGKVILSLVVLLNVIGFLWIRKIMEIDI